MMLAAASMTSSVMVSSWFILRTRVIWGEQSLEEPEVAAGYPLDCCNGLGIGEVLWVQRPSKAFPVAV
ncbi:hypothetical protein J7I89_20090 [Arthrobacter sp. ISL-5]|nr:hypothetical protein [Arthrobacter sp. ISL-5]